MYVFASYYAVEKYLDDILLDLGTLQDALMFCRPALVFLVLPVIFILQLQRYCQLLLLLVVFSLTMQADLISRLNVAVVAV